MTNALPKQNGFGRVFFMYLDLAAGKPMAGSLQTRSRPGGHSRAAVLLKTKN